MNLEALTKQLTNDQWDEYAERTCAAFGIPDGQGVVTLTCEQADRAVEIAREILNG